jgi:hypothetical protein
MNYAKPGIVLGWSVLAVIQSMPPKGGGSVFDALLDARIGTVSAYEADE